ncbi:MAG: ribosome recycling factor [Clostridia bacterium]|nr:ribosome recycling factor [Clostridia bacterium]
MKLDCRPFEEKMKKTLDSYAYTLSTLRAGRATPDVLSPIKFEYYGAPTPISQMAEIKTSDARTLVIQPWDASTVKDIEKAILASDLGITPMNDGRIIRLVFPQLTEERRKEMAKQISKYGEDAKVAIRNVRRDANDATKEMKKRSEMTEDEVKASDKAVQDLTDRYIKEIDNMTAAKTKEIMEI